MHDRHTPVRNNPAARTAPPRLSYKFQRLRETIRAAILRGEFADRLPGERELGRRYSANAKTINKALCDLSSEGILVRQIGRGTFVAPSNGTPPPGQRGRTVRCLAPEGPAPVPYREALLQAVGEMITARGLTWERSPVAHDADSGDVPLSGWPQAVRSSTDALVSYPYEPLTGGTGHLSDACVAELLRRHVPAVVLAGCAADIKLNAVAPDYVDAGFRLAEHCFRTGCQTVVALLDTRRGREASLVFSGCQTAASRYGRQVSELPLWQDDAHRTVSSLKLLVSPSQGPEGAAHAEPSVGIISVGGAALRLLRQDQSIQTLRTAGRLEIACLLEPGDPTAEQAGFTAYEVDPSRIAEWAARLMIDARPGHRPIEITVPGMLQVRGPATARHGDPVAPPEPKSEVFATSQDALIEWAI